MLSPSEVPGLRALILDAARELLLLEGYVGLSMRKIAARIGYSATAIYLHFENKDRILHALIEEGMEELYHTLAETADLHPAPQARLQALCEAYLRFGLDHPAHYEVMFMLHPRHMKRYPPEKYRQARRNLDALAQTLAELGVEEPRVAASAGWASLHGTVSVLLAHRLDTRLDKEAFLRAVLDSVVNGLLAARV